MNIQAKMKQIKTIALIILALWLFQGCEYDESSSSVKEEIRPVAVKASEITTQQVDLEATYFGQVRFATTTTYYAEMSGRVRFLHAKAGQSVSQGEKLVSFPPENHHLQIEQTALAYEELERNYRRQKTLLEKGAVAKASVSELKTQLDIQQKELERIRKVNVAGAPFSGVIVEVPVKRGEEVLPGSPLFTLADVSSLEAEFFVTSDQVNKISVGKEVTLLYGGQSLKGKVTRRSIQMDPQRRAFAVVATFDNSQNLPVVGGTAELKVSLGSLDNRIVIPEVALTRRAGAHFVFLAVDGKAKETAVTVEQRNGLNFIIKTGVSPGDMLITAGIEKLEDNALIEVIN